jgi:hypothetical protein
MKNGQKITARLSVDLNGPRGETVWYGTVKLGTEKLGMARTQSADKRGAPTVYWMRIILSKCTLFQPFYGCCMQIQQLLKLFKNNLLFN